MGGKSDERLSSSVGHARECGDYGLLCGPWVPSDMQILGRARRDRAKTGDTPLEAVLVIYRYPR